MGIIVNRLTTFLDGGTVGIDMKYFSHNGVIHYKRYPTEPWITVDYSINTDTPGKWFYGFKENNDPVGDEIKQVIIQGINSELEREKYLLNKISNG